MEDYSIDPELLAEFIDESDESLATLDSLFIKLESDPSNLDIINDIFRPVHSLKGNAAFFGLMKITALAHTMENLLDLIRKGQRVATSKTVGVLLPGLDMLREMLASFREGLPEVEDEEKYLALLRPIEELVAEEDKPDTTRVSGSLMAILEEMRAYLPENKRPLANEAISFVNILSPQSGDASKPDESAGSPQPGEDSSKKDMGQVELISAIKTVLADDITNTLGQDEAEIIRESLDKLFLLAGDRKTNEILEKALEEYHAFMKSVGFDAILQDLVLEKLEVLEKNGVWSTEVASKLNEKEGANKSEPKQEAPKQVAKKTPEKTMRVSEPSIDSFLAYVGELLVVGEMFNYLQRRLASTLVDRSLTQAFKQIIETFSTLSDNLRKSIIEIRRVPVKSVLQKAPRIIHDIASKTGKKVSVKLIGEDTMIDKSYVDLLDAPFTHIVRNAIDHGLEMPEDRIAIGKPETGVVEIAVQELENEIVMSMTDDGKGLDLKAI